MINYVKMETLTNDTNLSNFSARITYVRKLAGVSRKYIQIHYKIHENTIKKWETGHTGLEEPRIKLKTLREYIGIMEKYFGIVITEDWLFYGQDSKPFRLWLNPIYSMDSIFIDSVIELLHQQGRFFFFLNRNLEVANINPEFLNYFHSLQEHNQTNNFPITLSNLIGAENYITYYPYFSKALRGKKIDFELNFNNKNLFITAVPAKNANKNVIGVFNFINL